MLLPTCALTDNCCCCTRCLVPLLNKLGTLACSASPQKCWLMAYVMP